MTVVRAAMAYLAIDRGQGVSDAWISVATCIREFLVFLVVLPVGWLVAKRPLHRAR